MTAAAPVRATTPSEAIRLLNAQRTANGLPGGIVEDPAWSQGCRLHIAYLVRNRFDDAGGASPHEEDPAKPGYTPAGADAAANAELSWDANSRGEATGGVPWTAAGGDPWEDAPFHLQSILDPDLTTVGYADGCLRDGGGHARPAPPIPQVYTYPGPGRTIYREQTVSEGPASPGDLVGLSQPTTTGPTLYAWVLGGAQPVRLTTASLVGPGGAQPLRTVDSTTPGAAELASPDGAILIPVRPLAPAAHFTATVTLALADGSQLTHSWTFASGPLRVASTLREAPGPYGVAGRTTQVAIAAGNATGQLATITFGRGRFCSQPAPCQVRFTGRTHRHRVHLRRRTVIGVPSIAATIAIRVQVPARRVGSRLYLATDYGFLVGP